MYSKQDNSNSASGDIWTTTASMVDVKKNLSEDVTTTTTNQELVECKDFGDSRNTVTESRSYSTYGQTGTAQLSLVNINADNINYIFTVSDVNGEIISGNLSIAPISFTYKAGDIYQISYTPTDQQLFNIEIGDQSRTWASPIVNITLTWNQTQTTTRRYVLNSHTFSHGTSFEDVVKFFNK